MQSLVGPRLCPLLPLLAGRLTAASARRRGVCRRAASTMPDLASGLVLCAVCFLKSTTRSRRQREQAAS